MAMKMPSYKRETCHVISTGSRQRWGRLVAVALVLVLLSVFPSYPTPGAAVLPVDVERVSIGTDGSEGDAPASNPTLSADGRFVGYSSAASNWDPRLPTTPGPLGMPRSAFMYDRVARVNRLVSFSQDGTSYGDGTASSPAISPDGRWVAFSGSLRQVDMTCGGNANVPGHTPPVGIWDVFVRDMTRPAEPASCASVSSMGQAGNYMSQNPALSGDARFVAFESRATNLVPGDTNNKSDVFLSDILTGNIKRVSMGTGGTQANSVNYGSVQPAISGNGRFVAFLSDSTNLVPNDTNSKQDVFVHDVQSGVTERVSVSSQGTQGNGISGKPYQPSTVCRAFDLCKQGDPIITPDGRFVVFPSDATNLVAGDTNGKRDIFRHDRQTGETVRLTGGTWGQANGGSTEPIISSDGSRVIFQSDATNLVPGDTNGKTDIFLYDFDTDKIERVNLTEDGNQTNGKSQDPYLSLDGYNVAYVSEATNILKSGADTNGYADIYVRSLHRPIQVWFSMTPSSGTVPLHVDFDGTWTTSDSEITSWEWDFDGDGATDATGPQTSHVFEQVGTYFPSLTVQDALGNRETLYAQQTPLATHVTGHDVIRMVTVTAPTDVCSTGSSKVTERVSLHTSGQEGSGTSDAPSVSADGRYVSFSSDAPDLVDNDTNGERDVFVRDRQAGITTRVSTYANSAQASQASYEPSMSADGRFVAFTSDEPFSADDTGNKDVYVKDLQTGAIERASLPSGGVASNAGDSWEPSISSDGTVVAFTTSDDQLVSGDNNGADDVVRRDLATGDSTLVSVDSTGQQGPWGRRSHSPSISWNGMRVAFVSQDKLHADDLDDWSDVYLRDFETAIGGTALESRDVNGVPATGNQEDPALSGSGSRIAWVSANGLEPSDGNSWDDIYLRDIDMQMSLGLVSKNPVGSGGNRKSDQPQLNWAGDRIAFRSLATDLVADDTNMLADVFVHDVALGSTERESLSSGSGQASGASARPALDATGGTVVFDSEAGDLVLGDGNGTRDVFARAGTGGQVYCSVEGRRIFGRGELVNPEGHPVQIDIDIAQEVGIPQAYRGDVTVIDPDWRNGIPTVTPVYLAPVNDVAQGTVAGESHFWFDAPLPTDSTHGWSRSYELTWQVTDGGLGSDAVTVTYSRGSVTLRSLSGPLTSGDITVVY